MVSPVVKSALQQMRSLAAEASNGVREAGSVSTKVGEGSFADELRSSIVRINELSQSAKAQSRAFQAGDKSVTLDEVMVDNQKASVAFQSAVAVRNRLITAYKDVMNMQV